jgi:hypothetical protein
VPRARERIEKLEREVQGVDEDSITIQMPGYPAVSIPIRRLLDPEYHMTEGQIERYRRTGEMPAHAVKVLAEFRSILEDSRGEVSA